MDTARKSQRLAKYVAFPLISAIPSPQISVSPLLRLGTAVPDHEQSLPSARHCNPSPTAVPPSGGGLQSQSLHPGPLDWTTVTVPDWDCVCLGGRAARTSASISITLPRRHQKNLRRKSALESGARATALTPQTGAPSQALGLPWPLHRLRPQRARATAGRPIWARPPQRRSRERRGPEYARARGQRARTFCVRAPQPLRASSAPGLKLSARDLRA